MATRRGPFGIRIPDPSPPPNLGSIGYAPPQPPPPVDLSFLNDPNNPVYQQQAGGGGGGGGGETGAYVQSYAPPPDPGSLYYQPGYTPPDRILEQSPEWLAYINALGLQKGQFAADIARQREIAGANAKFAAGGVEPEFAKQRRGITVGNEARGMVRSGQQQRQLAESRGAQGRAYSGIYQNLQNTLSDLESNLAQKNLELDVQREQQRASMLSSGYKSNGLYDYLKPR